MFQNKDAGGPTGLRGRLRLIVSDQEAVRAANACLQSRSSEATLRGSQM